MSYFQANPIKLTFPTLVLIPSLSGVSCLILPNNHGLVSLISDPHQIGLEHHRVKNCFHQELILKFLIRFIGQGISICHSVNETNSRRSGVSNFLFGISHDNFPPSWEALILNRYNRNILHLVQLPSLEGHCPLNSRGSAATSSETFQEIFSDWEIFLIISIPLLQAMRGRVGIF